MVCPGGVAERHSPREEPPLVRFLPRAPQSPPGAGDQPRRRSDPRPVCVCGLGLFVVYVWVGGWVSPLFLRLILTEKTSRSRITPRGLHRNHTATVLYKLLHDITNLLPLLVPH